MIRETEYGLRYKFIEYKEDRFHNQYDKVIAEIHISIFNKVLVDEFNNVIDNEFDIDYIRGKENEGSIVM